MTASSRGCSRAAAEVFRSTRRPRPICTDCISQRLAPLSRRCYSLQTTSASNATPAPPTSYLPTHPPLPNVSTSTSTGAPPYIPKAGILLSRAPLLTAPQTRFEKAFFFYQKRLNERLALPYQPYFYFKRGTPADTDRKIKMRERGGAAARELGAYKAYGPEAWHDELLSAEVEAGVGVEDVSVGKMGLAEPKWIVESLLRDARVRAVEGKDGEAVEVELDAGAEGGGREEQLGAGEVRIERPLSRKTESDRVGDKRRLDRELTRTLYLLVQMASGRWGFPVGGLEGRENLHQAAERIIVQTAGVNMNTWVVGKVPVGHYVQPPQYSSGEGEAQQLVAPGEKQFFLKGRIMAGQANITGNAMGVRDFKWLTKEEVGKHVKPSYFAAVRNMLADR